MYLLYVVVVYTSFMNSFYALDLCTTSSTSRMSYLYEAVVFTNRMYFVYVLFIYSLILCVCTSYM